MSLHWQFSAYPAGTFAGVLGAADPNALSAFLEVIAWAGTEGGLRIDVPSTQELARHVLLEGLDYQGRSKEQSKALDDLVSLVLSPEGAEALGLTKQAVGGIDSPDHAWARFAKKAKRASGFQVLPWLDQGRRWRTTAPCADVWGAHLVLTPGEAAVLAAELQDVIAQGAADPGYREELEEIVLPQLVELQGREIELVGRSG